MGAQACASRGSWPGRRCAGSCACRTSSGGRDHAETLLLWEADRSNRVQFNAVGSRPRLAVGRIEHPKAVYGDGAVDVVPRRGRRVEVVNLALAELIWDRHRLLVGTHATYGISAIILRLLLSWMTRCRSPSLSCFYCNKVAFSVQVLRSYGASRWFCGYVVGFDRLIR